MVVKFPPKILPPLENGDHLTRDEFERRYEATPEHIKAELIEGVVYMASPVRAEYHGQPHFGSNNWLGHYQAFTPGIKGADNTTIRLDLDNEMQPDIFLFIDPAKGGQAILDADGYIAKAPELVMEISASSVSIDLRKKLPIYRRNQVQEYIVWRVYDEVIDWFTLRGNSYKRLRSSKDGIRKSEVFPGLWLDSAALLRDDLATVFRVVQQGLATPEHAEFVKRLNG